MEPSQEVSPLMQYSLPLYATELENVVTCGIGVSVVHLSFLSLNDSFTLVAGDPPATYKAAPTAPKHCAFLGLASDVSSVQVLVAIRKLPYLPWPSPRY